MKCYYKKTGTEYYSVEVFINNALVGNLDMTLAELNLFKETCPHVAFIEI